MNPWRTYLSLLLLVLAGCQPSVAVDASADSGGSDAVAHEVAADMVSAAIERIVVEEPTDVAPVLGAAALVPARLSPGGSATLVVRLKIAPGWHIYAAESRDGPNQPTRVDATLPEGCSAVGEWESPPAAPQVTPYGMSAIYQNEAVFRQSLRFEPSIRLGETSIRCDVRYQACDPRRCLQPVRLTLQVPVQLVTEKD